MHLYKYYPPKKHNFKAIAQKKIFFCYPSSLNDPNDTSITNIQAFPQFCRGLDVDNQKLKESLDRHAICCFSNLSFSFLYTYNSCFSTLALAGRPLFLVVGLAFET